VALLEQFDRKLAAVTKARHLDRRAAFEQKWSSVAACVRSVRDDRVEAQRLALYWVQIWLDGVRRKGGIYDVGDIRGGVRTVAERWLAYAGGQPVDLAQMPDHLRATIRRKPPSLAAYDVAEHYAGPADDARRTRPRKQASNAPAVIRDALEPGRRTRPR
jgi:hypothetical protein